MRKLLLITALVVSGNTFSQVPGYFGKRNVLDLKGVFYTPTTASLYSFFRTGDPFDGIRSWSYGAINYGAHASFGRIVGKNAMIALEYGYDDLSFESYSFSDDETTDWKIKCMNIMPKIEFSTKFNQTPLGVNHQLGVGYYNIKSSYELTAPGYQETAEFPVPLRGVTVMYALILRSAVSKHFLLNYGARYTYNRTFYKSMIKELDNSSGWDNSIPTDYHIPFGYAIKEDAQKRYNFVSLELGVTYIF